MSIELRASFTRRYHHESSEGISRFMSASNSRAVTGFVAFTLLSHRPHEASARRRDYSRAAPRMRSRAGHHILAKYWPIAAAGAGAARVVEIYLMPFVCDAFSSSRSPSPNFR